jgi:hypothetical protein
MAQIIDRPPLTVLAQTGNLPNRTLYTAAPTHASDCGTLKCLLQQPHFAKGMTMKYLFQTLTAACTLTFASAVAAQTVYNTVPAGDAQYRQCLAYAAKLYEGGKDPARSRARTRNRLGAHACGTKPPMNSVATSSSSRNPPRASASTKCARLTPIGVNEITAWVPTLDRE